MHSWYEGHIQGEDACPGCDYRGELPKQATRGWRARARSSRATISPPDHLKQVMRAHSHTLTMTG